MVKKGKKRSLEVSEATVKSEVPPQGPLKKPKIKKEEKANGAANGTKKIKNKPAPETALKKPEESLAPKKVKKQKKQIQNPEKISEPEEKKDQALKVLQKKLEAKKKKKELRKEMRKENGQFKPANIKLTADEIKIRIENFESKEQLSRTARRKLAALKKKLRIEEGTYTPPSELPKTPQLSKNLKRKIRRHKNVMKRAELASTGGSEQEITKKLEKKAKNVEKLVKEEQSKLVGKAAVKVEGKGKLVKEKGKKALKAEAESDDDDEEEEEDESEEEEDSEAVDSTLNTSQEVDSEDDDDEEDEENEEDEAEEADSTLNTSQEVNDDDDDEEDDEEDDEDDEKKVEIKGKPAAPTPAAKNPQQKQNQDKKTRYVLFIGNLPYAATTEDIKKHFLTKVSTVSSVRIPTDAKTNQPRGFAYVEFTNSVDYEKGLSLHESNLLGRRIKVQYSQPGSKSTGKRPEIVAKNQKLHAMRKQGQLAGSVKDSNKRNFRRNQNKSRG
ncbi:nucleolin [Fopius arisanus]|uniref:Nucleolin n=1 Tax=Fopius arisanus TaxID=64838 RepID=A0A9R1U858_9HYME|nr:PREDICTED: nucleolin-like [Fopius arisanus]